MRVPPIMYLRQNCEKRTRILGSVLGSWGNTMRDAVRNEERWKRRRTPTQDPSTDLLHALLAPEVAHERAPRHAKAAVVHVTRRFQLARRLLLRLAPLPLARLLLVPLAPLPLLAGGRVPARVGDNMW